MEGSAAASEERLEERLDELYREHPEAFVAGRNQLVKDLRAAGDRDEAERVKKLRRPTVAAWLINRAALSSPAQLREFAEASRQLEDAQRRALEGEDEGAAEWRAAAERAREATAAVLDVAERGARDAGHSVSDRTIEVVGETLRAATGDPELRKRVLGGRVEREQSGATLGTPAVSPQATRDAGAEKRRGLARARRELERLEEELAHAAEREDRLQAQVEQATEALRHHKSKLAGSKRESADLRRRVNASRRRAKG